MGRLVLGWRFRHFEPGGQDARKVKISGIELLVARGVFDPTLHFTSAFMANYVRHSGVAAAAGRVLDVGTGTGILAISAALSGAAYTLATDISPAAVACAAQNIARHDLTLRVAVQCVAFAPADTESPFNLVLCNPPYFRGTPQNYSQAAYMGGDRLQWFDQFTRAITPVLAPEAAVYMVIGDAADIALILDKLVEYGWAYSVAAKSDILIEVLYIFKLTRLAL